VTEADAMTSGKSVGPEQGRPWFMRIFASTGQRVIETAGILVLVASTAVAVVWQGLHPLTWRRTVRREFIRQCHHVSLNSLGFVIFVGALVGLGLGYQLLYWLDLFGQTQLIGRVLILVLGREIAPVMVGFIVLGRHGSVMLVELGRQRMGGQVHMLDSQGIDPFLLLVVPRVLAVAVGTFSLTMVFLVVALGSGFILSNALGVIALTATDFIDALMNALGPVEFSLLPLKSLCIGFSVGLVACLIGLSPKAADASIESLLPRAFTWSAVFIMLTSGLFTILLH